VLQPHYNGYVATCGSGLVKLYNPFSVVRALSAQMISNFWVDTGEIHAAIRQSKLMNHLGRYSPLSQNLWLAGPGFRDNLDLLLTQKSVKLVVDDHINFLRC
jgi:hypothetical protein